MLCLQIGLLLVEEPKPNESSRYLPTYLVVMSLGHTFRLSRKSRLYLFMSNHELAKAAKHKACDLNASGQASLSCDLNVGGQTSLLCLFTNY